MKHLFTLLFFVISLNCIGQYPWQGPTATGGGDNFISTETPSSQQISSV